MICGGKRAHSRWHHADDPFPDPDGLEIPPNSPVPTAKQLASLRVGDEEEIEEDGDADAKEEARREREARAQALTLEMVGDLPFADVAPPENVLFVCKLNAVTKSEDLELIFSRFGEILSCEIITDPKTGDSLQYAFIEFKNQEDAERAYLKMDNVLVDDRRIHVDFSQVRCTCIDSSDSELTRIDSNPVRVETSQLVGVQQDWRTTATKQGRRCTPRLEARQGFFVRAYTETLVWWWTRRRRPCL